MGGDTGNCEINSKLLSMCVLWVRVLELRTQGGSTNCSRVFVPSGSQSLVLAYSWVWGIHI